MISGHGQCPPRTAASSTQKITKNLKIENDEKSKIMIKCSLLDFGI